jgi:hypothetical protein
MPTPVAQAVPLRAAAVVPIGHAEQHYQQQQNHQQMVQNQMQHQLQQLQAHQQPPPPQQQQSHTSQRPYQQPATPTPSDLQFQQLCQLLMEQLPQQQSRHHQNIQQNQRQQEQVQQEQHRQRHAPQPSPPPQLPSQPRHPQPQPQPPPQQQQQQQPQPYWQPSPLPASPQPLDPSTLVARVKVKQFDNAGKQHWLAASVHQRDLLCGVPGTKGGNFYARFIPTPGVEWATSSELLENLDHQRILTLVVQDEAGSRPKMHCVDVAQNDVWTFVELTEAYKTFLRASAPDPPPHRAAAADHTAAPSSGETGAPGLAGAATTAAAAEARCGSAPVAAESAPVPVAYAVPARKHSVRSGASIAAIGRGCCDWLPQGPIADLASLNANVHQATLSCQLGGGGFKSHGSGDVPATRTSIKEDMQHGLQKRFSCIVCKELLTKAKEEWSGERAWTPADAAALSGTSAATNPKKVVQQQDLLWHAKYELAEDGNFYLVSALDEHFGNHELNQDAAIMRASASFIPDQLMKDAEEWARYGDTVEAIHRKLTQKAEEMQPPLECTWTYKYLYDRLRERRSLFSKDGEGYAELLRMRKEEGLPSAYRVNDAMEVSCSFAVIKGFDTTWACGTRVLLFDPVANATR